MRFEWCSIPFKNPNKSKKGIDDNQLDCAKGFYEINSFPGCNQLAVSNNVFLEKEYRGKGFGQNFQEDREQHLKYLGYDAVICTVKAGNAAEIHLLEKNGWKPIFSFFNRETENNIIIYAKKLNSFP